jgi:DUF1365 family protein
MTLRSSLYVGSVMHRRLQPRMHSFRYNAFWFLLDLDELAKLSRKLRWLSYNRPNVFSLYDADHGDGTATPLRTQVERQLGEAGSRYCWRPGSLGMPARSGIALIH